MKLIGVLAPHRAAFIDAVVEIVGMNNALKFSSTLGELRTNEAIYLYCPDQRSMRGRRFDAVMLLPGFDARPGHAGGPHWQENFEYARYSLR